MQLKRDGTPYKSGPGPVTLTVKRQEIGLLNQDWYAWCELLERFSEAEWEQITKRYPNAHRNIVAFRDAANRAMEKLEK